MTSNALSRLARLAAGPLLGAAGLALTSAVPAAAATINAADCATQSGTVTVRAVSILAGQTIILWQGQDGSYAGNGQFEVYCKSTSGINLGDVSDAQVKITVNPSDPSMSASEFTISGQGVPTTGTNPATVGPVTGLTTFTISAPSTLLPPGVTYAYIGTQFEVVTQAYGQPLTDPTFGYTLQPGTFGDVLAQTPELDSVVLFGSGAVGLVGYALMRRRALRSK